MAWKSGQSYSTDLRSRVLTAIDGGRPAKAVAQLFQVSVSYVYKALARREATGETEARPQRNHQTLKLNDHHDAIAAEVALRPDVTLEELRAWLLATHGVTASLGLMHKTLVRLGLTLKKVGPGRRAGSAGRRRAAGRLAGQAGRDEPEPPDLRRRDRGGNQHGPAPWPQPAWAAPGRPDPARSCVDAPSGARRISEQDAARDRVLPCVRPL
jgi:transposase